MLDLGVPRAFAVLPRWSLETPAAIDANPATA